MARPREGEFSELELIHLLEQIIARLYGMRPVVEGRIRSMAFDLYFESDSQLMVIEVKRVAPQTGSRLADLIAKLAAIRDHVSRLYPGKRVQVVLATGGVLDPERALLLKAHDIELWDRHWILDQALSVGLQDDVHRLFDFSEERPRARSAAEELAHGLNTVPCGRQSWSQYQRLCGNILEYLFCPPLEPPIANSANAPRVNIRDYVLPNYVTTGFWQFLRLHYHADYIVVDAKNNCGNVGKASILQLANYLSRYGAGLFGMILTRSGIDTAATLTCREQWMIHDKMIIVLHDSDLLQMIETKKSGDEPELLIRQKVEDFRLAL